MAVWWWVTASVLAVACGSHADAGTSSKTIDEPSGNGGAPDDAGTHGAPGATGGSTQSTGGGTQSAGGNVSIYRAPPDPLATWSDAGMCYPAVASKDEGEPPAADCPCLDPEGAVAGTACTNPDEECRYNSHRRCWIDYCICVVDSGRGTWLCPMLTC